MAATDPCRTCGGPVTLLWRVDQRLGGSAPSQHRTCPNPDCRTSGPRSQRRLVDRV